MDSQGFYVSPRTHYGNGAANSSEAFGAMGQDTMQQAQSTNVGQLQLQKATFEEEACKNRITEYMLWLQNRNGKNSIEFWREFVGEFYAPDAKNRLCVSMYDACKSAGVFSQESWCCEICNRKPGYGFEVNAENLPMIFKTKFESGALDEFMYIDKARGYCNSFGQVVLVYEKVLQETIFDQLRVLHKGQLRIVFSPKLKICSWEFCARSHEELVPRRQLVPLIGALGSAAQMYRAASSSSSASDIHYSSNMLANSAAQLADTFKTPLVNDLGYSERYIRSIQISEVTNSMKDLIDQFWVTGTGPIELLSKYSRSATKRPLSEEPSTQNPNKKKPLDFPPEALQLMCNSIFNPSGASSASTSTDAAQFISHQGMALLTSRGPRNSTNSPSARTHGPPTPSSSLPPPRDMNAANSTAGVMLFGQSNSSGGAMDVGSFGTDIIIIDDDDPPSGSNMHAPSEIKHARSSAIGPNLIPLDGSVEMPSMGHRIST